MNMGATVPGTAQQFRDAATQILASNPSGQDLINAGLFNSLADRLDKGGALTPDETNGAAALLQSMGIQPNFTDPSGVPYRPVRLTGSPVTQASASAIERAQQANAAPSPLRQTLTLAALTVPIWGTWAYFRYRKKR